MYIDPAVAVAIGEGFPTIAKSKNNLEEILSGQELDDAQKVMDRNLEVDSDQLETCVAGVKTSWLDFNSLIASPNNAI